MKTDLHAKKQPKKIIAEVDPDKPGQVVMIKLWGEAQPVKAFCSPEWFEAQMKIPGSVIRISKAETPFGSEDPITLNKVGILYYW